MTTLPTSTRELLFPYSYWESRLPLLSRQYREADPFPHIVVDSFLQPQVLEQALAEFPGVHSGEWIHYLHVNEKKYGKTDLSSFGPTLRAIVQELNSERFVQFLSRLTGIEGLFADESLEGGGLHQSPAGGFLNVHADFTVHPHHQNWQRRVNVLIYLNKNWQDAYGGCLELWDQSMKRCAQKIVPLLNRAVIFNTDPDSFHGHPDPIRSPEGMTRKSIALYYFTQESDPYLRSTEYRSRPGDAPLKSFGIYLDKMTLRLYDRVKRTLGFNDQGVSRLLKFFSRYFNR